MLLINRFFGCCHPNGHRIPRIIVTIARKTRASEADGSINPGQLPDDKCKITEKQQKNEIMYL